MGYSTSYKTVEKMRRMLAPLEQGKACIWITKPEDLDRTAYRIREALYAATMNKQRYPRLAKAAQMFKITVRRPDRIVVEFKRALVVPDMMMMESPDSIAVDQDAGAVIEMDVAAYPSTDMLENLGTAMVVPEPVPIAVQEIEGPQSQFTVVEAWSQYKGVRALHFPEAALGDAELTRI